MNGSVNKTKHNPQLMIEGGDLVQYFKAAAELCREKEFFSPKDKWFHHHFIAFSSYRRHMVPGV